MSPERAKETNGHRRALVLFRPFRAGESDYGIPRAALCLPWADVSLALRADLCRTTWDLPPVECGNRPGALCRSKLGKVLALLCRDAESHLDRSCRLKMPLGSIGMSTPGLDCQDVGSGTVLFRTLRGDKVSPEKLEELIKMIRKG